MLTYYQLLHQEIQKKGTSLCLGLDLDARKLPEYFSPDLNGILSFGREVITVTHQLVAAYKFNFAFYEYYGSEGYRALEELCQFAAGKALLIADAKRGDIGNTARFYAGAIFKNLPFQACTINPYMGVDTLTPFLEYESKGIYLLCLTSNPDAARIQKIDNGQKVYEVVIQMALNSGKEQCGLVVGATRSEELQQLASRFPQLPFLIPGIGTQGGDLETVQRLCQKQKHHLINVSRAILYPQSGIFPMNIMEKVNYYNRICRIEENDE